MGLIVDGRDQLNELPVALELLGQDAVGSDDGRFVGAAQDPYLSCLDGVEELSPFFWRSLVELRIGLFDKFLGVVIEGEERRKIVL